MMKMNTGAWIGIAGGVIGMIVGVGCVLLTAGSLGVYIAAGMVLLFCGIGYIFYKLMFEQMILAARLQKVGVAGKAVIKDIQDTNVTINNNPQIKLILDVKNMMGQVYTATVRTVVSRFQPFAYQVGMTVPVLIDPNDEQKLVLDTNATEQPKKNFTSQTVDYAALQVEMMKEQREGDTIRVTGKPAKAVIKKNTWLGIYINGNNPYTELQMEVLPDNAPSFEASVKAAVAEQSVAKYQAGQTVYVKYEGRKVAIDHS